MKTKLPKAQEVTLVALKTLTAENGQAPTAPEISAHTGYGTTWTHTSLNALEQGGYLSRTKQWRSMRLTRKAENLLRKSKDTSQTQPKRK